MQVPQYEAVVIGVSAGGIRALEMIISALPASFPTAIAVVQHVSEDLEGFLAEHLNRSSALDVKEAEDKEPLRSGVVYLAPAGYHLLIEADKTFSLSVDVRVQYSRPAIDVLFESAANVFGGSLIGIVLTGANADGAQGLKTISAHGGLAIVQDPRTAEVGYMPLAALNATRVDHVVDLEQIAPLLLQICASHEVRKNGPISANR
jgi:two-component system chemotaxis response regulator CheB